MTNNAIVAPNPTVHSSDLKPARIRMYATPCRTRAAIKISATVSIVPYAAPAKCTMIFPAGNPGRASKAFC